MQIVLAHPSPTPFVQQVGRALFEAGMLRQFGTAIVKRPDTAWLNYTCQLAKFFKFDLSKQLSRRAVTEFPLSLVKDYPLHELIRILVARLDKDKRPTDVIFHWGNTAFDNWIADQLLPGANAVYGYEYNTLATFAQAKQNNIARIYDVPSPEHDFVENILEEETHKYPELQTPYRKYCKARQHSRTQRRRKEWQLADVVIANSEFTKASYAGAGLDVDKVKVVPYGAPPVFKDIADIDVIKNQENIRFLWAGTFSIRKGAHHLLQAWRQITPKSGVQLDVYGAMGLPEYLLTGLPGSVNFSGTVPHSQLYKIYRQADVLVFPTLCDGFGMVVTEAFAQGLPVITTNRAGAADLIRHGVNGLIIPAGDPQALAETLNWCITHRQELKAMRVEALKTAASWQWSDYRQALITNLLDGLKVAGYS